MSFSQALSSSDSSSSSTNSEEVPSTNDILLNLRQDVEMSTIVEGALDAETVLQTALNTAIRSLPHREEMLPPTLMPTLFALNNELSGSSTTTTNSSFGEFSESAVLNGINFQ